MTKNQKIFLWTSVGIATAVGGYFLFRHFTKPKGGETFREVEEEEEAIETSSFPLRKGSRGEDVRTVQQYLNRSPKCKSKNASIGAVGGKKLLPLDEDGIFGNLTQSALKVCYNTDVVDEKLFEQMENALEKLSI